MAGADIQRKNANDGAVCDCVENSQKHFFIYSKIILLKYFFLANKHTITQMEKIA